MAVQLIELVLYVSRNLINSRRHQ